MEETYAIIQEEYVAARELSEEHLQAYLCTVREHLRILPDARLGHVSGDAFHFTALRDSRSGNAPLQQWQAHIDGRLHTYGVNCDHLSMCDPEPLEGIAQVLTGLLSGTELQE
ncbi:hypothetical protein ACIP10_36720 [Streptomyces galbus]|uniref:hypothetical protein n=1 Tax=Streptomyces galbus TaxID=33898 RepID=UPI0038300B1F